MHRVDLYEGGVKIVVLVRRICGRLVDSHVPENMLMYFTLFCLRSRYFVVLSEYQVYVLVLTKFLTVFGYSSV